MGRGMADMIPGSAQGAVDSLLGRLTSVLVDEALLLGGVCGNMQFIKDEMESMNGFLLHVAEADEEDHQVCASMKQVAEVAYASQNSIDLYIQSLGGGRREPGFLGYLRRVPKLVWTRAVKVPNRDNAKVKKAGWQAAGNDHSNEQEDARRRALADAGLPQNFRKDTLVKLLTDAGEDHGGRGQHNLKVVADVGYGGTGKTYTAMSAYQDPFVMSSFDCKAWITLGPEPIQVALFFRQVLTQLASPADQLDLNDKEEEELMAQLQLHLKGKRFLLVIDDVWDRSLCNRIKSAFPHEGSAIVITTRSIDVAQSFSPTENLDWDTAASYFYLSNAMALMNSNNQSIHLLPVLRKIVSKPWQVLLFLRALYVNPKRTKDDFENLCDTLDNSLASTYNVRQILTSCNLTTNCKNCLLHMSIFPEDTIYERTRLVRRWAVECMTAKRGRLSALDEADHCFDLAAHGFLVPGDMDITAKMKSCRMYGIIRDIVTQIAREDHFGNSHQSCLAHRLSVRYEVQPLQAEKELQETRSKSCWNICGHFNRSHQMNAEQYSATEEVLESLPSSTHLGVLEVLDLENCDELKDRHLKSICNHVLHLKYLSLRKTGITELPKQLAKLRSLETLDIRETKVKTFARNSVFLPKLKHLLAGHWTEDTVDTAQGSVQSKETFFTVSMPKYIGDMTELQVLSHIAVSGDGLDLKYVGNLLQLVKLGVVVSASNKAVLRHLYHATGYLGCLHSLSIRVTETDEENENKNKKETFSVYPKYLQKLKISGLRNELPSWIKDLKLLMKITLHMTFITEDGDFEILGQLTSLTWLRLKKNSCYESTLTFKEKAFQSLKFLVIDCPAITSISFDNGASPNLKKLVWSSTGEQSLSGIEFLPSLQELKLTGSFDLESVKKAIKANINKPSLVRN